MEPLQGKISDKIRLLLALGRLDKKAIHPPRPGNVEPRRGKKPPKGVDGQSLGRGGRRKTT